MRIIVKLGGSVIRKGAGGFIKELPSLAGSNELVVIHGGGYMVNDLLGRMGLTPRFVTSPSGVVSRYTDLETLAVYVMAMMKINKDLVSSAQSMGVNAVGLSGLDGGILRAKRKDRLIIVDERGRERVIEGGYTGKIIQVNAEALRAVSSAGFLPIIAPIAMDEDTKGPLNVDSDQVMEALAGSVMPDYAVMLTDVDGVLVGGSPIPKVDPSDESLLSSSEVGGGMRRKLRMAMRMGGAGIKVVIANGLAESPVSAALRGAGTHVY
ncbi:acetylglutamate kinase [Thermocladium modestius]|uniref:Putative [LysW]-aminoadipate/[LysW]-glutamate kinase n=1 Tax=Thermocladium modestius TaxID=62609 RepID=A0A830GWB7_9CREN|nr:[LysW]-aminoadipate/[LysW]-glutamate kinase [Thermocladium modestius]GGP20886.1 acetylglutamate kinase [Thermocladium modestius]